MEGSDEGSSSQRAEHVELGLTSIALMVRRKRMSKTRECIAGIVRDDRGLILVRVIVGSTNMLVRTQEFCLNEVWQLRTNWQGMKHGESSFKKQYYGVLWNKQ